MDYAKLPTKIYNRRLQDDNVKQNPIFEEEVQRKKKRGRTRKPTPEVVEEETNSDDVPIIALIPPKIVPVQVQKVASTKTSTSTIGSSCGEKVERKKFERLTKIKLGKKVVTKDGKGLDKENPVDLK
uniref:uncharacterized protein LOC122608379 isoform X2 n=1 Tax=Erigeron canadensis TaxID=72917 RepID=UPI001CB98CA7|nr:uncharacterized protein LOC122608379 isoform X2 [Erigeron canadensis]